MKQNVQFRTAAECARLACAVGAEARRPQIVAAHRPGPPGPRRRPAAEDGTDGKREEALSALSAATLAVMPTPVLILDAKGHCLDTNAAADRLLAATGLIRISGGVLVIADQDAQRQVADAVEAAAIAADAPGARALVALMLEGRRSYAAEVIPLSRSARRRIRAVAVLLLQEIGNLRPLPSEILAKLYGLTPAEARLVALLAQDFSLEHAAAALGIARTTAKTHLQHVFEKTGTNRQPQVVRLALSAISAPAG